MDGINKNLKSETDIAKLIEKKDYLGAEKELNKIIKFKKDNHHTYFLLGNIYAILNNCQKAVEQLNKSLNLNSDNKIAHYNLGVMLDQLGQLDDAQKSFKKALKIDPEYLHANLALALNFEKQNNLKEAKSTSPSVPVTPPKFSVPVISTPIEDNFSYSPKGTCQIIVPLSKFIAVIVPQGGLEIGYPFLSKARSRKLV